VGGEGKKTHFVSKKLKKLGEGGLADIKRGGEELVKTAKKACWKGGRRGGVPVWGRRQGAKKVYASDADHGVYSKGEYEFGKRELDQEG